MTPKAWNGVYVLAALLATSASQLSCQPQPSGKQAGSSGWFKPKGSPASIERVRIGLQVDRYDASDAVALSSARNEWVDFAVRLQGLTAKQARSGTVRLTSLKRADGGVFEASNVRWYEVADVPISAAGAQTMRHLGTTNVPPNLPRALLPLGDGSGKLAQAKNVGLVWADVFVSVDTPAGVYEGACEIVDGKKVLARVPVTLTVREFVLPPERNLTIVGRMGWDALRAAGPGQFEGLTKWLISRDDPRTAPAVKVLDGLMQACARNRVQAWYPDLQPVAKWPVGRPPELEWGEFDSVVGPWMTGEDSGSASTPRPEPGVGRGVGWWAVPAVDYFDRFDPGSQLIYWREAALHFDQMGWLRRTSILSSQSKVRPGDLLRVPQVRLTVPAHEATALGNLNARLQVLGDGLVSKAGENATGDQPHWLTTSDPGSAPYAGAAADERDVRAWGWLAVLDEANLVLWDRALGAPGNIGGEGPSGAAWVYPGSMFARDEPVETITLKWLRRAEQDFEYLRLARLRGEVKAVDAVARLVAKPVKTPADAPGDAASVYTMIAGAADARTFDEARDLIARLIELREPGQAARETEQRDLELETVRWSAAHQQPRVVPLQTNWAWAGKTKDRLSLELVMDLYNGSDQRPANSTLQWTALPPGWEVRPQPTVIAELPPYHATPVRMIGRVDSSALQIGAPEAQQVTFTNGFDQTATVIPVSAPVATCDRRSGGLAIDGSLDDWSAADTVYDGKLIEMLNRPMVQRQTMERMPNDCTVYASWSPDQVYFGFKVTDVSPDALRSVRNFVEYQAGRAWGEDLCEIVVQAVYPDNTAGETVHLVRKPGGQWVERKHDGQWRPVESASVRYAATLDAGVWRGELAVPWTILAGENARVPSFLRFNFSQHQKSSGRSGSWAGPVDSGREDAFTGVLLVREQPGEVVGK